MKLKEEIIGIKVDKEMKELVAVLANDSSRTVSDYLRLLIEYAKKHKIKL